MLGSSTQGVTMEVPQAALLWLYMHLENSRAKGCMETYCLPLKPPRDTSPQGGGAECAAQGEPMGAGSVLWKDVVHEQIKGFSRLVAARDCATCRLE